MRSSVALIPCVLVGAFNRRGGNKSGATPSLRALRTQDEQRIRFDLAVGNVVVFPTLHHHVSHLLSHPSLLYPQRSVSEAMMDTCFHDEEISFTPRVFEKVDVVFTFTVQSLPVVRFCCRNLTLCLQRRAREFLVIVQRGTRKQQTTVSALNFFGF